MSDNEVTLWIERLIGSSGGCITADSKRNLLQKYLQKQKDGASIPPLPMSSTVDIMPYDEVCALLQNQVGSFAECNDEKSQRNLLKTYLHNMEIKERAKLRDSMHLRSQDSLDYDVRHGNDFCDEWSHMVPSSESMSSVSNSTSAMSDNTFYKWIRPVIGALNYGYKFLQKTLQRNVLRPEATVVDSLTYTDLGTIMDNLNLNITRSFHADVDTLKMCLFSGERIDCTQEMKTMVNTTMQKYNETKQKLMEYYSDIIAIVQDESFKKEMSKATEVRFPNYEENLSSTKIMLQDMTSEFDIVIVGDTSAGKSTFLNVLLGESILPKAHSHLTPCLCRLHNSGNTMIKYEAENGTVCKTLKDSSELRERLNSINEPLLSNDRDDKPLKTIDLYWPISSLHEQVVLVDTPGIGERETLTKQVAHCVTNSAGYIFIVDSSHAGGVQDSGIKLLIKAIVESNLTEEHLTSLTNVLFVCNKWDLVPKGERKTELEKTKTKLIKCLGQLEDWQIVQFNAKLELQLQEWKANSTKDIKMLFKSLETLMTRTIEKRLRDKYRWLHTFVKEVLGFFNAKMKTESKRTEKLKADIQETRTQLELAKSQVKQIPGVQIMIDEEEEQLLTELQKYLELNVQSTIVFNNLKFCFMESKIRAQIKEWLHDAILTWAKKDTGPLKKASERIEYACDQIQNDLSTIFRSIEERDLGFNLEDVTAVMVPKRRVNYDLLSTAVITLFTGAVVAIDSRAAPLALASYYLFTYLKVMDIITSETETYMSTPLSKDHLRKTITDLFSRPRRGRLATWEDDINRKIDSMDTMLQEMEQKDQINSSSRCMLESLQTKFQKWFECLEEMKKQI